MDSDNSNSRIWTDNENTRSLIWQSYIGFDDNWQNYLMYKISFSISHKVYSAGMYRHAIAFFEQVRPFIEQGNIKIKNKGDVERILYDKKLLEDDNVTVVRRFISDFMFKSGISNIVFQRDDRDGVTKVSDKYGLM